jgi:hypothetical protein
MLQVLFAGDLVPPVEAAEREGECRRRRRDRLEAGINADRPSQAFGMTNPPSRVCNAMNFS